MVMITEEWLRCGGEINHQTENEQSLEYFSRISIMEASWEACEIWIITTTLSYNDSYYYNLWHLHLEYDSCGFQLLLAVIIFLLF